MPRGVSVLNEFRERDLDQENVEDRGVSHQVEHIQIGPVTHPHQHQFSPSLLRQQALLCPVSGQATSHIFYEPDAYDDPDQEDPDDDLDI